jgi:hypothetical protein
LFSTAGLPKELLPWPPDTCAPPPAAPPAPPPAADATLAIKRALNGNTCLNMPCSTKTRLADASETNAAARNRFRCARRVGVAVTFHSRTELRPARCPFDPRAFPPRALRGESPRLHGGFLSWSVQLRAFGQGRVSVFAALAVGRRPHVCHFISALPSPATRRERNSRSGCVGSACSWHTKYPIPRERPSASTASREGFRCWVGPMGATFGWTFAGPAGRFAPPWLRPAGQSSLRTIQPPPGRPG